MNSLQLTYLLNRYCRTNSLNACGTIKNRNPELIVKPMSNEGAYQDEPDKPGISDKDEEGEAHDDEMEKRWKHLPMKPHRLCMQISK